MGVEDSPQGFFNDYYFGPDGKLNNVIIKPEPDHFYQTDKEGKVSELNGPQLTPYMSAQYFYTSALLSQQDGHQLNEVVIKGQSVKKSGVIAPYVPWNASMGEAGIQMSFPIEGLFPGLRAYQTVISILNLVEKPLLSQKNDRLKGGKQNARDKGLTGYPKSFKDWLHHRSQDEGVLEDYTIPEIKELWKEWNDAGKPDRK